MSGLFDVIIVGYRSELFIPRLLEDIQTMSVNRPVVHYLDNIGNTRTLSRAWNELAGKGKADWIAVLNPDVAISPEWDERLMFPIRNDNSIGMTNSDLYRLGGEIPSREEMVVAASNRKFDVGISEKTVEFFSVMISRKDWDALGGVDERMRFYCQDIDFIVRIRERLKKRAVRVSSCPIWHRGGASVVEAKGRREVNTDTEWEFGCNIFTEVRWGRMKEWQNLSDDERDSIRRNPEFTTMAGW